MRKELKIEGVFLDYEGLRKQYGLPPSTAANAPKVDPEFDGFLKRIAGKDVICADYRANEGLFKATMFVEDPERPGSGKMISKGFIGRDAGYADNMSVDKLASIDFDAGEGDGTDYIFCDTCGFTTAKSTRYDYEPSFTYGDIYDGNIDGNPNNPVSITGVEIKLKANLNPNWIFCPSHLGHSLFKELPTSYPYNPRP